MMKELYNITLLIALLSFSGSFAAAQEVGEELPGFTYNDINGDAHSLSDYEGEVVFLFLFGNGCPFCLEIGNDTETRVNQVFMEHENFQALGLDLWDASSSVSTVSSFQERTGITYPLLLKAGEVSDKWSTTYDRLMVVDHNGILAHKGSTNVSNDLDNAIEVIEALLQALPTGNRELEAAPGFSVSGPFPNPVRGMAGLTYSLRTAGKVSIDLMDITGQQIRQVFTDEYHEAGEHMLELATDDLQPGIYFISLDTGNDRVTRKMVVTR